MRELLAQVLAQPLIAQGLTEAHPVSRRDEEAESLLMLLARRHGDDQGTAVLRHRAHASKQFRLWFWCLADTRRDTDGVDRSIALVGGVLALLPSLASLGFALWATGADSVLGGLAKTLILVLACGSVVAASGGLAVALNGIRERAWLLHGLALFLAGFSYFLALAIAERA